MENTGNIDIIVALIGALIVIGCLEWLSSSPKSSWRFLVLTVLAIAYLGANLFWLEK